MDVREAAEVLAVSHARVRRLCAAAVLPGQRKGGRWLIPAAAVLDRAGPLRPGRPPAPRTVWNLLAALDGHSAELSARERGRALHLLEGIGEPSSAVRDWRRMLAPRAHEQRVRVHPGILARLATDDRVRPGGAAAAPTRLAGGGLEHLYLRASDLDGVSERYRAVPDPDGRVVLHIVDDELVDDGVLHPGRAAAAADLLGDPDPRSVTAGAEVLTELRSQLLTSP